ARGLLAARPLRRTAVFAILSPRRMRLEATRRGAAPTRRYRGCRLTWRLGVVPDNAVGSVIRRVLYLVFVWPGPFRVSAAVPGGPQCADSPPSRKLEQIFAID